MGLDQGAKEREGGARLAQGQIQDSINRALDILNGAESRATSSLNASRSLAEQQLNRANERAQQQITAAEQQAGRVLSDIERNAIQQSALAEEQAISSQQPYSDVGNQALQRLAGLSGLEGAPAVDITASPEFQFRQNQLNQAVSQRLAAQGLGQSQAGTQAVYLPAFQQLTAEEIGRQRAALTPLAGMGQQSANMISGLQQSGGQQRVGITTGIGGQQAQNIYGTGQNLANLSSGGGTQLANLITGTGTQLANSYLGTGQAGAGLIGELAPSLAITELEIGKARAQAAEALPKAIGGMVGNTAQLIPFLVSGGTIPPGTTQNITV